MRDVLWEEVDEGKGSHLVSWEVNGKNIVSEHGLHHFEWLSSGVKGTYQNLWKNIFLELPSFSHFVHCVVGEGKVMHAWEDEWVRDRSPCFMFPCLDYLSSLKNCLIYDFLVG